MSICLFLICFCRGSGKEGLRKSWANSELDINNWGGQEGREWLLQYSYVILTWLPATRPCTVLMKSHRWLRMQCCIPPQPPPATSPFSSPCIFSHLPSICHLLFPHSSPCSAISSPVFFPLPLLFIPFSSASISQKSMACPWAKFNYRPN